MAATRPNGYRASVTNKGGNNMLFIRRLMLVPVLALALSASTIAAASTAGASNANHPFVGAYTVTVHWTNPVIDGSYQIHVNADHTVTISGHSATWSHVHRSWTMVIDSGVATYNGTKTAPGFNSAAHPGTMSNNSGNSGTWYAVYNGPTGALRATSARAVTG